jgi:hypothetical protein
VAVPEAAGDSGGVTEAAASTGVPVSIQLIGGPTACGDNLHRSGRLRVIGTRERITF